MQATAESSQSFQELVDGFGGSASSPGASAPQAVHQQQQEIGPVPPLPQNTRQSDEHEKYLNAAKKEQKAQWDTSVKQIRNASSEWSRRRRDLDNILARSGQHAKTNGTNTETELKEAIEGIDESDTELKQHELEYQMSGIMGDTGITDIKAVIDGMVEPIKNVSKLAAGLNVWMRL